MRRFIRQIVCGFCLLLCGMFCTHAMAMGISIDTEATGTLTVSYAYGTDSESENNLALSGVCFRIYRVASVSEDGTCSLTADFADSGVTDTQLNSLEHAQDVDAVVDTLVAWIKEKTPETEKDSGEPESETETEEKSTESGQEKPRTANSTGTQTGITASQESVTDETGTAVFENLQTGVYLLIGDSLTAETVVYSNSPSLASIPSANPEGTGWEYEITIVAKAEAASVSQDPDPGTDEPAEEPTEAATEASTGTTTEPTTEPSTGTTTEPSTEAVTEPQTEGSTTTEPSTETVTEPQTEASTEAATDAQTEAAGESPTGAYIEPVTESSDWSSSEYSTEIVTDTKTENGSAESETTDTNAVQTGDDTPIMAWLLLLCGAFAVLAAGMWHRRQSE